MTARYLADKSALVRLRYPTVDAFLTPLILAGEVATCSVIDLEVLFSTRSYADFTSTRLLRDHAFPLLRLDQVDFDRTLDVMELLARRGQHRGVSIPDLLIAAVAERSGVIVLHYDGDFDLITAVTGQAIQWVVPRGSVP